MVKIIKFFTKDKFFTAVLAVGIIFFFIYSFLAFTHPAKFNSPDETVNYYFTKLFAEQSQLSYAEELGALSDNIIHPRAIIPSGNKLVPMGFWGGSFIYGLIAKILGLGIVLFLTPIFSVLAALAFYGLIKKIFTQKIAFVAALLLLIQPAFWYYSTRGLFSNILFVDLLLIGLYFILAKDALTKPFNKNKIISLFLGCLFLGLSLIVRPSEVIWLAAALLILLIFYFRQISKRLLLIGLLVFIIALIPFGYINNQLYGASWKAGYNLIEDSGKSEIFEPVGVSSARSEIGQARQEMSRIKIAVMKEMMPFGMNWLNIYNNFKNFYVRMLWWQFGFLVLGGLIFSRLCFLKKSDQELGEIVNKPSKLYFWLFGLISVYLFVYYGSWQLFDNIAPSQFTIGDSHLRYYLPSYIMALPFAAILLLKLIDPLKTRGLKILLSGLFGLLLFLLSFQLVYLDQDNGIIRVNWVTKYEYPAIEQMVGDVLPREAVVIVDYADKILWPKFKVIDFNGKTAIFKPMSQLAGERLVYYYLHHELTAEYLKYLREKYLFPGNLEIIFQQKFADGSALYKIIIRDVTKND